MGKNLSQSFRSEKNKLQSSATISLYAINLENSTWVYYCAWDKNVTFDGQVYTALPITREEIQYSSSGEIASLSISVGNANRVMGGYLEAYNGLISQQVIITTVFADLLGEADAKVTDEFYVRTSYADERRVSLQLSTKLSILNVRIPSRRFTRNFCQWEYKNEGCWLYESATGGYTAAAEFTDTLQCDHTLAGMSGCEFHTNEERFGGFYGIPQNINSIRI